MQKTSGIVTGDAPVSYWPILFPCPQLQSQKSLRKLTCPSFLVVARAFLQRKYNRCNEFHNKVTSTHVRCCDDVVTTLIDGVFWKVNSATSDRLQLLSTKTIDKERYEAVLAQPKLERNSF